MSDYNIGNLLHPSPLPDEDGQETDSSFSVDDRGIPILDDVVEPGDEFEIEAAPAENKTQLPPVRNLELPGYEELLAAMRNKMKRQLEKDMEKIIDKSAVAASGKILREIEPLIRAEISRALQDQFSDTIQALLDKQFDKT